MNRSAFIRGLLDDPRDPQLPQSVPQNDFGPRAYGLLNALFPDPYEAAGEAVQQFRAGNPIDAFVTMYGAMPATGIIPPKAAGLLSTPKSLPQSEAFSRAVEALPGARIEDGSLVMPVVRRQMSAQHNQPSVRGGVFYLPQGDKRLSHYNGAGWYGGQDKIAGETAVSNPLFVRGATGGKAPEAAYAALFGKDAMKQLDRDVFSAVNEKGWMTRHDPSLYPERIAGLLDDYGADPSLASHIIDNSTLGNQLRYALQENIIGSAVRNAGHDAILGYSVGRNKNPFFSELFDLRESHYPGRNGEYRIWDRFNPAP